MTSGPISPAADPCCNRVLFGVVPALVKAMRRRDFIKGIAGSAAAVRSLAARAQQPIPAIGYLGANALDNNYTTPQIGAFRQGLKESGLVEERDLTILFQWADGHYDRLPALATELVSRNVSVIFASSLPSALAAKQVTSTIPIVFAMGADPVKLGVVASLNRPGSNVTGMYLYYGRAWRQTSRAYP
jgi:putative tryptophan/tyrosine transport system substrate-binding protein